LFFLVHRLVHDLSELFLQLFVSLFAIKDLSVLNLNSLRLSVENDLTGSDVLLVLGDLGLGCRELVFAGDEVVA